MNMYEDAGKVTKEAMDNALKSFAAMTKGLQQITAENADFAKKTYEQQTAMMEKLVQAKTLDKSIEVQTDFAKTAYENWVSQVTKINDIYAGIAKETYKPFENTAAMASNTATKAAKETASAAEKKASASAN
ncbi:phasin family protein [Jiella marina]|uniref:phasin family protein n=1 Tax=Jiella sp. LLJ827 TaxID=2917712 RepID=UPI002101A0CD|nr:phasin family protein [Jiella sp. LLJ827]MCQ0989802.1 phasin family protein [Jiella sp. LLJ827]